MENPARRPRHPLDASVEPTIFAFERAWRESSPPSISDFVASCSPDFKVQLVQELAVIDMEFRWQASAHGGVIGDQLGTQPKWSDYARHVPDVGEVRQISAELIAEEYRVRQLWGDRPGHDRFMSAFPEQFTELPKWLAMMDDELRADGAIVSRPQPGSLALPADPDPRAPLPWSDYLLHEHLGSGGFGKVYRAVQKSLDRPVAVKALHKARQQDPLAVEQFIQEARLLARLKHHSIVAVHGLGRFPGGGYFLVLDWIDGEDLQRRLNRGPLTVDEAVSVTMAVGEAIQHAHERGVIHGDLKPSNVLRDKDGHPHVTDFGLAHLIPRANDVVRPHVQGGTLAFSAPEVVSGGRASVAADVFGLGALFYALLTGRPPRHGTNEEISEQLESSIAPVQPSVLRSDVPVHLDSVAMRCLDADIEARYPTVSDVVAALSKWQSAAN